MFRKLVTEYFEQSTLHGLRFIDERDFHWTERALWLVCCVSAWFGAGLLMASAWLSYSQQPIGFGVSTSYLRWNTSFPAVSICESDNRLRTYAYSAKKYGPSRSPFIDEILNEIAFFDYRGSYIKFHCGFTHRKARLQCPEGDLKDMAKEMHSPCKELLYKCWWRGQPFDCCQQFLPLETELGNCFSMNSIHTRRPEIILNTYSNWETGLSELTIELNSQVKVLIHGPEELPSLNAGRRAVLYVTEGARTERHVAVREMSNGEGVRAVAPALRRCRFPEEPLGGAAASARAGAGALYSYSGCLGACRRRAELRLCGCANYLAPGVSAAAACDLRGAFCLHEHHERILALEPTPSARALFCDCPPSCEETTIDTVYEDVIDVENGNATDHAVLIVKLAHLSTLRDHRQVVIGPLDFVVSVGSAFSLFVGGSMLSVVELLIFFGVMGWKTVTRLSARCFAMLDRTKCRSKEHRNPEEEVTNLGKLVDSANEAHA